MFHIQRKTVCKRISQVCMLLFYILLFASTWFQNAPVDSPFFRLPGESIWFRLLVIVSLIPIITGPEYYRMGGLLALLIAVILLIGDCRAGHIYEKRRQERLEQRLYHDRELNR